MEPSFRIKPNQTISVEKKEVILDFCCLSAGTYMGSVPIQNIVWNLLELCSEMDWKGPSSQEERDHAYANAGMEQEPS